MGIKSTFDIERETAIDIILGEVIYCTNQQLSNILDEFDKSYYRNYIVYNELPDDNPYRNRIIRNISKF